MKIALFILAVLALVAVTGLIISIRLLRRYKAENTILNQACNNFRSKKYVKSYVKRKGWRKQR